MSAGGFSITVEQFNNVHFHAFPILLLCMYYVSPIRESHDPCRKDRDTLYRGCVKRHKWKRGGEMPSIGERLLYTVS